MWVVAEAGLGAIALAPSDVSGGVIMPDKAMDDENRQCGDCTTPPTETDCTSHNTDEWPSSSCEGPATEDACQETSTVDDLLDQLKKAEKEIEELNSRYLRALADYDNAKKERRPNKKVCAWQLSATWSRICCRRLTILIALLNPASAQMFRLWSRELRWCVLK